MSLTYSIKQGDYLAKIAKDHGFSDWKIIWNHADNKGLKDKRKDPNILYPGDRLFIPDREEKHESIVVDDTHKFAVKRSKLKFALVSYSALGAAGGDWGGWECCNTELEV